MKTHIDIDEKVLSSVQALGGYATKREAVHAALTHMARRLAARELLKMRGTMNWQGDLNQVREPRFAGWDEAVDKGAADKAQDR